MNMNKIMIKPLAGMGLVVFAMFSFTTHATAQTEGMNKEKKHTTERAEATEQDRQLLSDEAVDFNELFDDVNDTDQHNALELLRMEEDFSTFVEIVEMAQMESDLKMAEPITIFAPTNASFARMPVEEYKKLKEGENLEELRNFVKRHVLPTEASSAMFEGGQQLMTQDDEIIRISTEMHGTAIFVGGAEIVRPNIEVSNGIVHVVDGIVHTTETPIAPGMN